MKTNGQWRSRIVGYGKEAPDQFLAHDLNFRRHPKNQQDALSGVLNEVGVVQNVIVSKNTGKLLDGHLRVELALRENQKEIPVTYVDISESEERTILATLDPLSALAFTDKEKLDELLREVKAGDSNVTAMLADLAKKSGLYEAVDFEKEWEGMPEHLSEEIRNGAIHCIVRFQTEKDRDAFQELLGYKLQHKGKTYSVWFPEQNFDQLGKGLEFSSES